MPSLRILIRVQLVLACLQDATAFSAKPSRLTKSSRRLLTFRRSFPLRLASQNSVNGNSEKDNSPHSKNPLLATYLALTLSGAVTFGATPASHAYVPSDYASDTVQAAVQELTTASGNVDATFKAYENIAGIITEGKGVGGMVNYSKYVCQQLQNL
jgi:hypothetical protein